MGFTLKREILHINISGLLSLQRLTLEILPGETRTTCSQLFLTSPCCINGYRGSLWLWLHLRRFFPPRQRWAGHGPEPNLGHSSWVLPAAAESCWLGRRSWVTLQRVPVCGSAQASRHCGVGLLRCDCGSTDVWMDMLPPGHEIQCWSFKFSRGPWKAPLHGNSTTGLLTGSDLFMSWIILSGLCNPHSHASKNSWFMVVFFHAL